MDYYSKTIHSTNRRVAYLCYLICIFYINRFGGKIFFAKFANYLVETIRDFRQMTTPRILIIYTGGTIGMGKNAITGALEPLDFNHLVSSMPEFQLIQADINVRKFEPPIDSSDMDPLRWAEIVEIISNNYQEYDGFVILHGTDTMAYTASALSFMLENLTKPVILTGSQLPIGELRTDGKENLMTAIEIASMKDENNRPLVPEVCIFFNGKLLRGNRATKINAEGFHAFDSFNHPHLCDVGINFTFHSHHILTPDYNKPMVPHLKLDPNVIVFSLFPGIQDTIVRHVLESPTLRGIVMRTYGSGNAPQAPWIMRLLDQAAHRGINIINISQCITGSVDMERYDAGFQLKIAHVISGYDSTVEAAVTKLMYLQGRYADNKMVRQKLKESLAGEITIENK